ncbi:MAG: DUF3990 domain-containing protein, partial [Oscillospiraceae bacterium]|nr:DUF3990 domain-containing protein [Oscillospiraceae bacterium]
MEQKKLDEINTNEITKEAWNAYQEDYAKLHMPDYEWAKSHAELDCYEPMISLIGDVKGLKLLDTCCSADAWQTYSWHNRGAKVTVKEFAAADREWMRFIVLNRESNSKIQEHEYDIVIGPTAND